MGTHAWTSGKYEEHEACWNGSTGWVPWHESTLTQRLHRHFRKPWHFLQDKVTPLCTSVQKNHKELCQDFSKENHLGTAGRISCWFESFWRDPNLAAELFNQPCSSEHILNPFFCFPNPSRLSFSPFFGGKEASSKGNFCHSSLQPAILQRSLNKICLCVEHIQMLRRLKTARTHNERITCAPVRALKDSKNHRLE